MLGAGKEPAHMSKRWLESCTEWEEGIMQKNGGYCCFLKVERWEGWSWLKGMWWRGSQRLRDSVIKLRTSVSIRTTDAETWASALPWQDGWQPRAPWGVSFSKECGFIDQERTSMGSEDEVCLWFPGTFWMIHALMSGRWKCFRKQNSFLVINLLWV